jgi:isopentenyl phosphate kinase
MLVLKIGGSAITDKSRYMAADPKRIGRIAKAIADAFLVRKIDLVIVHGAGSFGHPQVMRHGIKDGVKGEKARLGFAETHWCVSHLSQMIVEELVRHGVPAVTVPPVVITRQKAKRISSLYGEPVNALLKSGYVPVLHGDVVLDSELGGSVCSGDQLCSYIGKRADKVIFITDVEGIFAGGRLVKEINCRNFKGIAKHVGSAKGADVTGGMRGKLEEIMKIGRPSFIVSARHPERIKALLLGKKAIGTKIVP